MPYFGSLTDDSLPSRITPTLYVGSLAQASCHADRLAALNITHIVNATPEHVNAHAADDRFTYHRIGVKDTPSARLDVHFERVAALQQHAAPGATLFHCFEGISRSATLALACMLINGDAKTLSEAMRDMRTQRPVIEPNAGFLLQLQQLEKSLAGHADTETTVEKFDKIIGLISSTDAAKDGDLMKQIPESMLSDVVQSLLDTLDEDTVLETCLMTNLERYASTASKHDAQALYAMCTVLTRLACQTSRPGQVIKRVEFMRSTEIWKDVCLDAPLADKHAKELVEMLVEAMDPATKTTLV